MWDRDAQGGGEDHESLTELDPLPAAEILQQANNAVLTEVTAVSRLLLPVRDGRLSAPHMPLLLYMQPRHDLHGLAEMPAHM